MVIFVLYEDHFHVRVIGLHPVRPRAHRETVDCNVFFLKRALLVKTYDLFGHRREKWHGKPVDELGVFFLENHPEGVVVDLFYTRKCVLPVVEDSSGTGEKNGMASQ
jgi:hypothetical protein